jgi:hypothetical protein
VLVCFECNPAANQYRRTVGTSNGQLTAAITKNINMAQLAAPDSGAVPSLRKCFFHNISSSFLFPLSSKICYEM